jgi:hypothetical protein
VSPGDKLSLEVDVEVKQTSEPLSLRIQVPAGVTLVDGATEETLVASPRILRTLQLQVGQIPPEDLRVEVEQRGPNWGVRATASYRFGRPEPMLPQPETLGVRRPGIPGAAIPLSPRLPLTPWAPFSEHFTQPKQLLTGASRQPESEF